MNPAEFRRGAQYIYTGGPVESEYVTFMYPEVNHYQFADADGRTIRLSFSEARTFIRRIP